MNTKGGDIIKIKIIKKFFSVMCIVIISLNQISLASDFSDNLGDYRIYSRIGKEKYIYYEGRIQTNYEYFYLDKNGSQMPAYCLQLGVDGAETQEEYYVNVSEKLKDKKLNNIILNGYPYKSVKELEVKDIMEAKYATQFAIWSYLSNLDINKIVETSPDYVRVVNAIKKIYNKGINLSYDENNLLNVKSSEFKVDNVDKNYLSANIFLEYNENLKDINLEVKGISEYKITDNQNNEIKDFVNKKEIKILIPRSCILNDINIEVKFEYNTRQTAIMFGKSKIPNMQSLALSLEPITLKKETINFKLNYVPINFVIEKCDKEDNNIKLKGVKFKLYDMNDKLLGEYETDKSGKISIDVLKTHNVKNKEKIKVVEQKSLENYYFNLDESTKIIQIDYDKENKLSFENEKIKGKIKIIKTSSQNNEFNNKKSGCYLENAIFEIYDMDNKLVQEIKTDESGVAISKDLLKGKYYIKEKSAPKFYILDEKIYEVEINEHNKVVEINLKNDSQKKIELPKTGY